MAHWNRCCLATGLVLALKVDDKQNEKSSAVIVEDTVTSGQTLPVVKHLQEQLTLDNRRTDPVLLKLVLPHTSEVVVKSDFCRSEASESDHR
ncbi:hypothetical protein EYZ11_008847 [Aspergillus tanneri]|uniref:Uncharacterized protein n=1 Tax=Aspergillus tanneri TaxID=1220188 RepID=A0A4S3J9S6_9EURO|nr:uncharacterized protein ATNIH1004_008849 [Aspergillus tanneri]KAA8644643.1 hypothetical protein ATNIH1004_008849 [Aspergillus tanneri]THC91702.1 hypothetical protein EYZ11_008847 [Aspergillus tanneri]